VLKAKIPPVRLGAQDVTETLANRLICHCPYLETHLVKVLNVHTYVAGCELCLMFLFNPLHVTRRCVYSTCKIADDAATGYRQEQVGGAAFRHTPPSRRHMSHVRTLYQFSVHSEAYQRLSWEALKKSIHGLINKVSDLPAMS